MPTTPSRPRRRRRALLAGSAVIVITIAVALALFEPWRLFTRSTVDEVLPIALVSAGAMTGAPDQSPSAGATGAPTARKAPSAAAISNSAS